MEMNPSEFRGLIHPLEVQYRPLDEEKFDLYYERLKTSFGPALQYAVDYLLDSHRTNFFPQIHEIKDAIDLWWKDQGEASVEELREKIECPICRGMGFDVREEVSKEFPRGHNVAYFCRCETGKWMLEAHRGKDQESRKPKDIWKPMSQERY